MNRKLSFVFFLLPLAYTSSAQKGIKFSIFANPCVNWFQSDIRSTKSGSAVMGFDAGLTLDNYFTDNYAFTSGLSIGSLGGNLKYNDSLSFTSHNSEIILPKDTNIRIKLQYITIPLGLKFKTKEIGYFTYFAHLGLTAQMNIKARGSSTESATFDNDDISDEINFFNLGYHIGAGTQYSLGGSTALILGITFTNGFIDITKVANDKVTSSSLALRLGMIF